MGLGAAIGLSTAFSMASSYFGYKGQEDEAEAGKKAAKRRARYLNERKRMAQSIAIEKTELEIAMETERLEHETGYIIGQLKKKEATISSSATAGYAASGVTVGKGGSVETVLDRIASESKSERDIVLRTAELELSQFTESREQSLEWFMEQSEFETAYGVETSLDAAKQFGQQSDYAQLGTYLGPLAAGMSGAADYGMMKIQ
jgi:hypothetical protein